jgi:hypothetical protein
MKTALVTLPTNVDVKIKEELQEFIRRRHPTITFEFQDDPQTAGPIAQSLEGSSGVFGAVDGDPGVATIGVLAGLQRALSYRWEEMKGRAS